MKETVRAGLAWLVYGIGHVTYAITDNLGAGWLYPLYNKLMILSVKIQGPSTKGPWQIVKED